MFVVYTHAHTHAHTQTHSCNYAHRVFKICLGEGCSVGHHPAHTSTYKGTYTYIKKRMRMYVCTICTHCIVLYFVVLYCIRLALPTHTHIYLYVYTQVCIDMHTYMRAHRHTSLSLSLSPSASLLFLLRVQTEAQVRLLQRGLGFELDHSCVFR